MILPAQLYRFTRRQVSDLVVGMGFFGLLALWTAWSLLCAATDGLAEQWREAGR